MVLYPNQSIVINYATNAFAVTRLSATKATLAWQHTEINFKATSLTEAVNELQRWYNTDIEIDNNIGAATPSFTVIVKSRT